MSASTGRMAIVAGAGGELGRATAEKLAAAGFTVVGVDRSAEGLKELPDSIRRETGDPTDPAVARSVVDPDRRRGRPARGAGEHHRHVPSGRRTHGDARRPAAHDRRQRGRGAVADPGGRPVPAGTRFGFTET
jgi:NAD(P)-dependent dehydrogenase (short-subunit alcohol dehydrogenase family)